MLGEDDRNQSPWGQAPEDQAQRFSGPSVEGSDSSGVHSSGDHGIESGDGQGVGSAEGQVPRVNQPVEYSSDSSVEGAESRPEQGPSHVQPSAVNPPQYAGDMHPFDGQRGHEAQSAPPASAAPVAGNRQAEIWQSQTQGSVGKPVQAGGSLEQTQATSAQVQGQVPTAAAQPWGQQQRPQTAQTSWAVPYAGYPGRPETGTAASSSAVRDPQFKGYVDSSAQPGQRSQTSQPGQYSSPTQSPQSGYAQAGQTQPANNSYAAPFQGYGSYPMPNAQAGGEGQSAQPGQPGGPARASQPDQSGQFASGGQAGQPGKPVQSGWKKPGASAALRNKKSPGWLALIIAMVVTALVAGGGATLLARHYADRQDDASAAAAAASNASQSTQTTVPQVTSEGSSPDWQAVANAVGPAVVTINVTTQSSEAVGSGVVYDQAGHIVTNYHVISAATTDQSGRITVTLSNGSLFEATVVGYDQTTDLAVISLKNPPSDLTVARFGSSADVTVGQNVMAIGAPLGLSNTVTTGVISALDRPVEVSTSENEQQQIDPNDPFGQLEGNRNQNQNTTSDSVITNAIQVDASINPGNSGGPLFDQTGAVIGINSSIASMSSSDSQAGSIGLGFAIPSDLVKNVADQLISTGKANHGVLGVTIQDGTATVDGSTRLGAKVVTVTAGGAADQAGIKQDDIILSVGGKQVVSSKSLTGFIRTYQPGDKVELEVVRDGKVQKIQATLQATAQ